jgi:DNA-3-methyladenine glycosylase II
MFAKSGKLKPKSPFDFKQTLNFLNMVMSDDKFIGEESLTRALLVDGQIFAFKIINHGSVEEPLLNYDIYSPEKISKPVENKLLDQIVFYLSLNDDLKPFYDLSKEDPVFKEIIKNLYGFHHPKFLSPFESACWAVISQRTNMKFAYRILQDLINLLSRRIDIDGTVYKAFPDPRQILEIENEDLNSILKNKRKTVYLKEIASAFQTTDLDFLKKSSSEDLKNWLLDIKGIGEFSAELELIRGFGRMEILPTHDKRLLSCFKNIYGENKNKNDLIKYSNRYNEYKGYWALYMRVTC